MLSKRELYQAYYQGNNDHVIRKEILRYGKIVNDYSYNDDNGHWREYVVEHEGMYWKMVLCNGTINYLHWSYSY